MTEQLNIEGKRSGEGFVCHRAQLASALAKAQSLRIEVCDVVIGRKGFTNYLRLLHGSNIVKVAPENKGLRLVCGANASHISEGAWLKEGEVYGNACPVVISPQTQVNPNLGAIELAEALSKVIPFVVKGKKAEEERPILSCVRFAQSEGKLTLTGADGYRLAEAVIPFEDGEGQAIVKANDIKGLASALKRAKRARLSFTTETTPSGAEHSFVVVETEAISYKWESLTGNYPDYAKVMPTEFVAEARLDTRDMLRIVASLYQFDRANALALSIGDGKVKASMHNGKAEAEIEALTTGEARIGANPFYLAQALKVMGGMVEMKVNTPQSPILFSVDGYRHILMPVQIAEEKPEAEAEAEPEVKPEPEAGMITCPHCEAQFEASQAISTDGRILCPQCEGDITEAWDAERARAEMEAHSAQSLPPNDKRKRKRKAKASVA